MLKFILSVVFSLACLAMFTAATSQAKGPRSSGGRRHVQYAKPNHPKMHHHKHKHKPMVDIDVDADSDADDAEGDDADEVGDAEGEEADEAETTVYGVEITELYKGTAAKQGINVGDIILNFNGTPTPSFEALANAVSLSGSRAQVLIVRGDGGERETVTLFPQNGRIGVAGERVPVE